MQFSTKLVFSTAISALFFGLTSGSAHAQSAGTASATQSTACSPLFQTRSPGYAGSLPYTVATVELAEGPRLLGRVEPPAPLAVGDPVVPCFVEHASWTELCFGPAGS